MGFRNPLVALSQLIADTITGAVIQTSETLPKWVLSSANANSLIGYSAHTGANIGNTIAANDYQTDDAFLDLHAASIYLGPKYPGQVLMFSSGTTLVVGHQTTPGHQAGVELQSPSVRIGNATPASGNIAGLNFGSGVSWTAGSTVTIPHGLGVTPKFHVGFITGSSAAGVTVRDYAAGADATNIYLGVDGQAGATGTLCWFAIA